MRAGIAHPRIRQLSLSSFHDTCTRSMSSGIWNVIDNCCQKDPTFIIIVGAWSITAVVKTQIARLRIRKCWSLYNMEGRRSLRRTSIGKCGILTTGIFLNNDYSDRIYFTNLSQRPFVYRPWWWGITVQVLERIKSLCFTKGFTI